MRLLLIICVLVSLAASAEADEQRAGPTGGTLLLAGGNLSNPKIFAKFLEFAGGSDANLVIIPTAMPDEYLNEPGFESELIDSFRNHGFQNISILHTRDTRQADSQSFVDRIDDADAIWFTGGRQWRIADGFLNTRSHQALRGLLERGGIIGGSSAGATIQGSYLARGDTKTNTVMMGDHEHGLGFLVDVAIDQHLLRLNRQYDIFEIIRAKPELLGLGIDEDTAIIVQDGIFEVVGSSFVAVYDGTFSRIVHDTNDWSKWHIEVKPLAADSNKFYLLGEGRRYDLQRRLPVK